MGTFLLAFLFVILIPLAEGGLLALFLREIYNRCPLPLDEIVEVVDEAEPESAESASSTMGRQTGEANETEPAGTQDSKPQDGTGSSAQWDFSQSNGAMSDMDILSQMGVHTLVPSEPEGEPQDADTLPTSAVDVFDNAGNIPADLPIADALNAMMADLPSRVPNDLDNLVEQQETDGLQDIQKQIDSGGDDNDDTDENEAAQIAALCEAMPQETIDFEAEQAERERVGQMSETAKELLGADFNVDELMNPAPNQEPAEAASLLSVQNLESGLVQVQTSGLSAADVSQFFFTEESCPMFVRKRRAK
jgi:hypothetical protein